MIHYLVKLPSFKKKKGVKPPAYYKSARDKNVSGPRTPREAGPREADPRGALFARVIKVHADDTTRQSVSH